MKHFYFIIIFLANSLFISAQTTPTGTSTEVGITEGQLSVSLTGGASYSIPIAVPPGINGAVPQISLAYNSQGGNGMAGLGWNISGVSSITRIPTTKFHDGTIDGVDFNSLDRFAFDGQRLIVKSGTSGTYGANGTIYETENFSNVKITSYGVHSSGANYGPAYFVAEYPDGSKAYFGNSTNSQSVTDWAITYWENPQGVRISYTYFLTNNIINIASIKYGSRTTTTPINEIQFVYKSRKRPEQTYVGGQSLLRNTLLSEIKVFGNSVGYRQYKLAHQQTSVEYERLERITETSGDGSKSYNPTVFVYNDTSDSINYSPNVPQLNVGNISSLNAATVSGDFDGDGNMDFLLYPTTGTDAKSKYWLFSGISPNFSAQTIPNMGALQSIGKFEEIFPVSWLSWSNKLMPMQGWNIVKTDATTNSTTFSTFSTCSTTQICYQYDKQYTFPKLIYYSEHPLSCIRTRPPIKSVEDIPKSYISGDFNGDGLTDIVAVERNFNYSYLGPCDINDEPVNIATTYSGDTYFVNLDRRITSNYVNIAGKMNVIGTSILKVADFNGDGKSDIYVFDTGKVKIYSLNDSNQFVLLFQTITTDANIALNKPILIGDYNGDGKSDFMIPKGAGFYDWYRYISTGNGLNVETKSFGVLYPANDSYNSYNFIPTDYDNDGKTDLLITNSSRNTGNTAGTIGVRCFTEMSPNTIRGTAATSTSLSDIDINALPIFLPSTDRKHPRLEIAFVNNNKLYFFNSSKDSRKDRLLNTTTTGNGVKETITYQPLDPTYKNTYNSIYTSSQLTENYPYFDIVASPDFQIVTKLEKQSASVYKKQLFGYYGAVTNFEGLGFMGFRSIMQTNWHDDVTTVMSNISNRDIYLRGAIVENYMLPYIAYPYGGFTTTNFTSKSVLSYNTPINALQGNKVFKLQNTITTQYNGLDNTSSETTTLYDVYNNPTTSTILLKEGATVVQTSIGDIAYESPTSSPYYIVGRPTSNNQSISITGEIMTSQELYNYNTNQLLSKVEKNGTATATITEDNIYDIFGNITKKTITAPAPLTPRVTDYEYDTTGRFLTKVTDIERLETTFLNNQNSGVLEKETNPYLLSTSYTYDSWFKRLTAKNDNLNKTITYSYAKNVGNNIFTTTGDATDGSVIEDTFDDLGRKIKSGVKDVNGTFSYVSYLYDIYDRNYKVSEPYFGTAPSQWNETKFDIYSRPIQGILFTGKTTSTSYSGLTTTLVDGLKNKITTKNAIGNVISMQENTGGIINYTYFANGNLKQTSYNGININIEQDGWGRKNKLIDPTAGTFIYNNNAFGELDSETTQNGAITTTILRDNNGKPTKKNILGPLTDSETTYVYDPSTKLPTVITFVDKLEPAGTNTTTTTLSYDPVFKRITSVVEDKTNVSKFTKTFTYDGFGRIETESKKAEIGTKTSTVTTKNVYQNGSLYQIRDNLTSQVLWQTNALNAKGQLLENIIGNGIKMTNTYDTNGYLSKIQHDKTVSPTGNIMTLTTEFDKNTDNLDKRINSAFGNWTETFKYDDLARLKEFTNGIGLQEAQNYEASGKIKDNSLGTYNYTTAAKPYQNTSITLTPEATGYYGNREGIFNDSMESKAGWSRGAHNPQCISFDNTKAHTGQNSVKINTAGVTESYVQSDVSIPINNTTDTEYTFSGWVYSDSPIAQLTLFMLKEGETAYYTNYKSSNATALNQWVHINETFLVPANIRNLSLRLDNVGTGNVWFDDVKIRKTNNAPLSTSTFSDRQLNITYNAFKSPVQIEETGVDKISFTYNDDNQRSSMFYGGLDVDKLLRPYRKHYSADGSMEIKENSTTGAIEFVTYVGGDGYSAPIVVKSDGINPANYLYLHRDYQGSIMAITDVNGLVVEKRLYDAWGNITKVQDGAGNILAGLTVLDRGYTGHEHLQSVGLINMNARLYDPKLHRFLSADNYIQDPSNTQNYNQYGYVLNNPLMYTDPSGNMATGNGNECIDCGPNSTEQTFIGNAFKAIVDNWDNWGIKDWAKKNLNFNNWNNSIKSARTFFNNNWKSAFGGGHKDAGPPPNMSQYVNIDSQTNGYLSTTASLLGGASGAMNELSIFNFYNSAPKGFFAVNYNGMQTYWSEGFKGGTRGGISYSSVQAAKAGANGMKLASKFGGYASYAGSYIGYYGAIENLAKGDYYGSIREGVANYAGIKLAATMGNIAGIGWTIGWNILGPWLTNTETYNSIFFGKNSAVYQDREKKNGWYESKILKY